MQKSDIELELERVETACSRNVDEKTMYGLIARGIWQVALQLSKLREELKAGVVDEPMLPEDHGFIGR